MPEIATKLANRLKQPHSKRRIRLYDEVKKVDLLEKLRVGLIEVVRGIGTDGDPLHRAYVMAQNQASLFAEIVSQLPEFAEYGSNAAQNECAGSEKGSARAHEIWPGIQLLERVYFSGLL
jgi:hypothetical protein